MADYDLTEDVNPDGNSTSFSIAVAAWTHDLVIHSIVGFALALVLLLLRIYTRTRIVQSWGWDDTTICVSMLFFTGYVIILWMLAHWALTGTHVVPDHTNDAYFSTPGAEDHRYGHRLWETSFLVFIVSVALARISIGLLYLRVTRQVTGAKRWICHILMWTTGISSIIVFSLILFECSPFGANIETDNPRLIHCMNVSVMPVSIGVYGVLAIIVDFGLFILPAWLLWPVQMDRKNRFGAMILLSMGVVASVAVAWRLAASARTGFKHLEKLSMDDGYELKIKILISCIFEGSLGIQASCLATLVPLYRKIREVPLLRRVRDHCRSYFRMPSWTKTGRTATSDPPPSPFVDHPGPLTSNPPNAFMRSQAQYQELEELHRARSPPFSGSPTSFNRAASPSFPGIPTSVSPILDPEPPHRPTSPRSMSSKYNPALPAIHSGQILRTSETVSTLMSIPMTDSESLEIPGTLTEAASKANLSSPTTVSVRPVN